MRFEKYAHHGVDVWVRSDLKGKHSEHCLCYAPCTKYKPGTPENCPKAQLLYMVDVNLGVTTPVFECPDFEPGNANDSGGI